MEFDQAVAYCAGFFDGEGCISIEEVKMSETWCLKHRVDRDTYREYRLRCQTSQKYSDLPLHIMAETLGGKVHQFNDGLSRHLANGRTAVSMLRLMLPYLMVKRDQAEIAVQWFEMTREERIAALKEVRTMKKTYELMGA